MNEAAIVPQDSDPDWIEQEALFNGYLTQLMAVGNEEAAAMPLAARFARKRLRGEVLSEIEDLALLGITLAIDFE